MSFWERGLPTILEKLVKALFEWLASLWYEMVEYLLEQLMDLFHTDLSYFADRVPVVKDIGTIFFAVGWALLIGNLAFQALRSMVSGVGIESEEPGRLFLRTAMFSFLLMVSRQICEIGLGLSSAVMDMLQVPNAITFDPLGPDTFSSLPNAGWIFVILVNVIIQWQTIKLFFEVAERYVILCVLTYCAPLAFAMGGSKSTGEIFRGWARMYASMCTLMVFNLVFVKLLISAMTNTPSGAAIIPWTMLAVGIVRMAKKMDGIILRIGMNPALTGDPLGARFPGMLTAMTLRGIARMVTGSMAHGAPSTGHSSTTGAPMSGSAMPHGGMAGSQTSGASSAAGAAAQGGAGAGAAGAAAPVGMAVQAAGTGARVMNNLASFRSRSGVGDPATMRQVSQAISIDADDWEDGSIRSQNQSVSEANTMSRLHISPVSPAVPPVPADFGRMSPPKAEAGTRMTVMPSQRVEAMRKTTAPSVQPHPSTPAAAGRLGMGDTPQQSTSGMRSARPEARSAAAHPVRVTPMMPVSQPPAHTVLQSENTVSETHSGYTEQNMPGSNPVVPSAERASRVMPAAVAAASVGSPPNATGAPSRTAAVMPKPERAASIAPSAQRTAPPAQERDGSIRVTPVVPHTTTPGQAVPRAGTQPPSRTAVQPPTPAPRAQEPVAPAVSPATTESGRRPAVSPAAPAPDSRPVVSPGRHDRPAENQPAGMQGNVMPGIRTPDMIGRPQVAEKTHRLRRSAQPLKNKVTPQEGGKRHKRRKKK